MLRHGPLALGWCATALTLCGLAALQSLCWSRDVVGTNSRKLLLDQEPVLDALVASCVKTYRFQWWGWALQLAYLAGATLHAARSSCTPAVGIHILGATATVLAMLFANDNLKVGVCVCVSVSRGGEYVSRLEGTWACDHQFSKLRCACDGALATSCQTHAPPQAMDDAAGILFSRLTLTFVGFTLIALFNFLVGFGSPGHLLKTQNGCSWGTAHALGHTKCCVVWYGSLHP